jgi:hypothetical protein
MQRKYTIYVLHTAHFVQQNTLEIRNLPWRMGRVYDIHSRICFSFFLDADSVAPSLRIVRHPGSTHLRRRRRPLPGQRLGRAAERQRKSQKTCQAAFFCVNSRQHWVRIIHLNIYDIL